jgi:hypothetical protein
MRHLAYGSRTPMSVESLARCALASPDLQWGIQPIVWERWAKGSGCQKGIIGGLLVYKHLNSTMDHVRNICRIGEAVSTRMWTYGTEPATGPHLLYPSAGKDFLLAHRLLGQFPRTDRTGTLAPCWQEHRQSEGPFGR